MLSRIVTPYYNLKENKLIYTRPWCFIEAVIFCSYNSLRLRQPAGWKKSPKPHLENLVLGRKPNKCATVNKEKQKIWFSDLYVVCE
jgi:hypothetical protein